MKFFRVMPRVSPTTLMLNAFLPKVTARRLSDRYYRLNHLDTSLYKFYYGNPDAKRYFLSGFNPLLLTLQEVQESFQAYRSKWELFEDILRPLLGVGNILRGLFDLALTLPVLLIWLAILVVTKPVDFQGKSLARLFLSMTFSLLSHGTLDIVRGVWQNIFFLPNLLIRVPIKRRLTAKNGYLSLREELKADANKLYQEINEADSPSEPQAKQFDQSFMRIVTRLNYGVSKKQALNDLTEDAQPVLDCANKHISFLRGRSLKYVSKSPKESALDVLSNFTSQKTYSVV